MSSKCAFVLLLIFLVISSIAIVFVPQWFNIVESTSWKIAPRKSLNESNLICLIEARNLFSKLNVRWFITYGSALFFHRDRSFETDDIDTGILSEDLFLVADRIEKTFVENGFSLISRYGTTEFGREWTFSCPQSLSHLDIFVFYPPLEADRNSSIKFSRWCASYNGICNSNRFRLCRFHFSSIALESFRIENRSFNIVDRTFLAEAYGASWRKHFKYDYFESLTFIPNLIHE